MPGKKLAFAALAVCAVVPLCAGCRAEARASRIDEAELRAAALAHAPAFSGRILLPAGSSSAQPLRLRRSFGDSLSFARISGMRVVGGSLLVTDRLMSPHLAVVDLRSGSVVRRFGRDGRGPREFRDPAWMLPVDGAGAQAWVYDFQNRRFVRVSLDAPRGSEVLEEVRLDAGYSLESPVWTERGIISNGLFPDFTLLLVDSTARPLARMSTRPPFDARRISHPTGRRFLNRNFMAVDPARRRLALAYQYESRLDFLTAEGIRYGTVTPPRRTQARWRIAGDRFFWDEDNETAYVAAAASDRYVYALFCGCRDSEKRLPRQVHVFTWSGDLVAELALDREVLELTVAPDDSHLYGAIMEPVPVVGEWDLPAALRERGTPRGQVALSIPAR